MRQFAISDIHGCSQSFEALLDKISFSTTDVLFLLGDYIDRGPGSKLVIDRILDLQSQGYQVQCLLGNHEHAMLAAKQDWLFFENWRDGWGGMETLESFNTYSLDEIEPKYWEFLNRLKLYIETEEHVFVHAGLDFSNRFNPFENTEMLLFGRNWYDRTDYYWLGNRIILHGHTPIVKKDIETLLFRLSVNQFLNIDNGCVYDKTGDGYYHLCAFDLTNWQLFFQKNLDDVSGYWSGRSQGR